METSWSTIATSRGILGVVEVGMAYIVECSLLNSLLDSCMFDSHVRPEERAMHERKKLDIL